MDAALPIAAGLDWLEGLLPLLFVLYWIGSQLLGLFRAVGGDRKPAPPVPPVPRRPAGPHGEAEEGRGELERQIKEFLRQSTRRAGEHAGGRGPAVRDKARPRQPASGTPPPLPATPARQPSPGARIAGRKLSALEPRDADVSRHVQDAFAHDLGHLGSSLGEEPHRDGARPGVPGAVDVAALLRNPATLRQLFMVREVLDRPVERW